MLEEEGLLRVAAHKWPTWTFALALSVLAGGYLESASYTRPCFKGCAGTSKQQLTGLSVAGTGDEGGVAVRSGPEVAYDIFGHHASINGQQMQAQIVWLPGKKLA